MTDPHTNATSAFEVELEEGQKYFFCTCGLSQKQPFCDGAHKGSGLKSLCFTTEATRKVWLCGCKKSKTLPYCDASHMEIC